MPDIAVYPGSFDPITNGHLDLIQRALKIFDHIVVAVATNAFKKSLFTIEERMEMIRGPLADNPNVSIDSFEGLLVKYARARKARAILQGRYYVSCDDVEAVAPPVLRHRIICNFAAQSEGITPDELVRRYRPAGQTVLPHKLLPYETYRQYVEAHGAEAEAWFRF
jgi:cytidyltransferase-like protein